VGCSGERNRMAADFARPLGAAPYAAYRPLHPAVIAAKLLAAPILFCLKTLCDIFVRVRQPARQDGSAANRPRRCDDRPPRRASPSKVHGALIAALADNAMNLSCGQPL